MAFQDDGPYHEIMRLYALPIIMMLALASQAFAYELLMVQAVSASKKTFVTRNGKRQGIIENMDGTFVTENASFIAKAKTVTSQFTQWELVNPEANIPFQTGDLVTYHPAQEYIWSLNPAEARKRYIRELRPEVRRSWLVKAASTKGLNETVSGTTPQSTNRGGIALDILYERLVHPNFAWDLGLRYEREVINLPAGSLITQRALLVGDLLFYFDEATFFYNARFYMGAGFGYGQSSTSADGLVQSGAAVLLPAAKLGVALPFDNTWDFIAEGAFETLKTSEKLEDGTKQETTQSNLRIGFGLRRYF